MQYKSVLCYDFSILVDHSCGHDRQRKDRLNVKNMIRGYDGLPRSFKKQLELGAILSMVL